MTAYQERLSRNENTFIAVSKETGKAVAEISGTLASNVNIDKYYLLRPSEYLPTLNKQK